MHLCRSLEIERARLVRDYLSAHACGQVTLQTASRELGMSQSTMRRVLRTNWNSGFHAEVERLRVERALAILNSEPDVKIDALALAVGWGSRANLYAAVRRVTGQSLAALRSLARAGIPA